MIKKQERNFKGVWIPKEVWLSTDLTLQEKVFLVEIDSLDNGEKGCFASNQYFAEFFGLSIDRCSVVIGELKRKKLIEIDVNRSSGKSIRKIKMMKTTPLEHSVGHCGNTECPHCGNTAPNNTVINNKDIHTSEEVELNKQISTLIDSFKLVNPTYKELFKYKGERGALKYLIEERGFSEVEKVVNALPHLLGKEYAPQVTKPSQLRRKYADVVAYYMRLKGQQNKNKVGSTF